ncbi:MAG: carboxylating nicotinate-nucleotide diphosphorylase [Candidatus Omnitrophota bacterium]
MQAKLERPQLKIDPGLRRLVKSTLIEDDYCTDITTRDFIQNKKIGAVILAKGKGVLCGISIAQLVFDIIDRTIKFKAQFRDGDNISPGAHIVKITGRAETILKAERTALNFLSHLSGIATATYKFVQKASSRQIDILDTRKTLPGLRKLQKYAVTVGGGQNHRSSLSGFYLIKDNHLKLISLKQLKEKIEKIRKSSTKIIEVEVKTLSEFKNILPYAPDIIMLDNMHRSQIKEAIRLRGAINPHVKLELSGGIDLDNINRVLIPGIDRISLGALTHSAAAFDFSLEIKEF